jgi:hypothetical protein
MDSKNQSIDKILAYIRDNEQESYEEHLMTDNHPEEHIYASYLIASGQQEKLLKDVEKWHKNW